MATYFVRRNGDGTKSVLTIVKVGRFRPVSKSFRTEPGVTTLAQAKEQARGWAEPLARSLKKQPKRGGARADLASLTVGGLIKEYLADPTTKALKSFDDYHALLDWWLAAYAAEKVLEFNATQLRDARERLASSGRRRARSAGTVNRHLSAMRSCWNWGRAAGLVPQERAWPTRLLLTEPRGRTRHLSSAETDRLLRAADADPVVRAAIVASIATGVRQGELLRLAWADVDLDGNKLAVHLTKSGAPRQVYLAPVAVEALRALKEQKVVSPARVFLDHGGAPLSQSRLIVRWRKVRKAAGLSDFRWHDLRHSCASFLAQRGATLLEIGSVLGHSSPSVTMRYAHLIQGAAVPGHAELDELLRGK